MEESCLMCNGFGLYIKYYLNLVSSILLFTIVPALLFVLHYESFVETLGFVPFAVLNGIAFFKNYRSLYVYKKDRNEVEFKD